MNAIDLLLQSKDDRPTDPTQAGIPGARAANDALAAEFAGALADAGAVETSATTATTPTSSCTPTSPRLEGSREAEDAVSAAPTPTLEKPRVLDAVRELDRPDVAPRRAPTRLAGTPKLAVASERATRTKAARSPSEDLLGWLASRFEVLDTGADRAPKASVGLPGHLTPAPEGSASETTERSSVTPMRADETRRRPRSLLEDALPFSALDIEEPSTPQEDERGLEEGLGLAPTPASEPARAAAFDDEAPTLRPPPSSPAGVERAPQEPRVDVLEAPLFMPTDAPAQRAATPKSKSAHAKRRATPHQGTRAVLSAAAVELTSKTSRATEASPRPRPHAPAAARVEGAHVRSGVHEHATAAPARKHASPIEGPRPAITPTFDAPETTFVAGPVVAPAVPPKDPTRDAGPNGRPELHGPPREKLARATSMIDEVHLQLATQEEPSETLDREMRRATSPAVEGTHVEGTRIPLPVSEAQAVVADRPRDTEKQAPFALPTSDADTRARRQDDAEAAANRMTLDRKVEARTVTDDLGTVTVTAEPRRGEVTMSVVASRPETAALIAQNRAPITEDLRTHAMEVGALNVSVDSGQGRSTRGEDPRERSNRSSRRSLTPVSGTPRALDADPFAVAARRVRIVL